MTLTQVSVAKQSLYFVTVHSICVGGGVHCHSLSGATANGCVTVFVISNPQQMSWCMKVSVQHERV